MVDFFLLMQLAGAGDELQGIKKGIIELADLIVINKADGDNIQKAELAKQEYSNALHYIRHATETWQTLAVTCSAQSGTGIHEIWEIIQRFRAATKQSGAFKKRRINQNTQWFDSLVNEFVLHSFYQNDKIKAALPELRRKVVSGELPVAMAVTELLKLD